MMKTEEIVRATKCWVLWLGNRTRAYADESAVRVYDDVAGHFVLTDSLTPAQVRYVRRMSGIGKRQPQLLPGIHKNKKGAGK